MVATSKLAKMRHPANPNRHPANQIALFAKILQAQGWRAPIVVSKLSNLIVAGHGALEAAIVNGYKQCPVDFQEFENEGLELAHMSADNELARLSESDANSQESLLKALEGLGVERDLAGVLKELAEPVRLEKLDTASPPAMTWALIGIATVRAGEILGLVEQIQAVPGTIVETTVASAQEEQD